MSTPSGAVPVQLKAAEAVPEPLADGAAAGVGADVAGGDVAGGAVAGGAVAGAEVPDGAAADAGAGAVDAEDEGAAVLAVADVFVFLWEAFAASTIIRMTAAAAATHDHHCL
jgi:hypothetical protein